MRIETNEIAVDPPRSTRVGAFTHGLGSTATGVTNGVGLATRFNEPFMCVERQGTLYVADGVNHQIRSVDVASSTASDFAGTAGVSGSTTGVGTAAMFDVPWSMALLADGVTMLVASTDGTCIKQLDLPTVLVSDYAGPNRVEGTDTVHVAATTGAAAERP